MSHSKPVAEALRNIRRKKLTEFSIQVLRMNDFSELRIESLLFAAGHKAKKVKQLMADQ